MLVIKAGIHKMLVRIANREDPDQTASSELSSSLIWACTVCLGLFFKATSVRNLRTFSVFAADFDLYSGLGKNARLAPVLKTIFHQFAISYTCS